MVEISIEIYLVEISLQRFFLFVQVPLWNLLVDFFERMFGRFILSDIFGRICSCGIDLFSFF